MFNKLCYTYVIKKSKRNGAGSILFFGLPKNNEFYRQVVLPEFLWCAVRGEADDLLIYFQTFVAYTLLLKTGKISKSERYGYL